MTQRHFVDTNDNDAPCALDVMPRGAEEAFIRDGWVEITQQERDARTEAAVSLTDIQAAMWAAVKALRATSMLGGVSYGVNAYQSREVDLNVAAAAVTSSTTWPKDRPALDNTIVSLSKADAQAILTLITDLYYAADVNAQTIRAQIYDVAITTKAELEAAAININTGWPTVPYSGA